MRLNIPTTMADVTLGQYQEFVKVRAQDLEPITLLQRTVEIFCRINSAREIEIESIAKIEMHIANMLNEQPTLRPFWGDLGFVPNLREITFGELIDLDRYMANENEWHKAMAVLFRKVTHRFRDSYAVEPYNGTGNEADKRKDMPLDVAFGAVLFFLTIGKHLATDTLPYLEDMIPQVNLVTYHPIAPSLLSGGGIKPFLNSQGVTSRGMTKSRNNRTRKR